MLNVRIQDLTKCFEKLHARVCEVLARSRRNPKHLANRIYEFAARAWLVSTLFLRRGSTFLWLVHCASFISAVRIRFFNRA
jgi:hypothetical protein